MPEMLAFLIGERLIEYQFISADRSESSTPQVGGGEGWAFDLPGRLIDPLIDNFTIFIRGAFQFPLQPFPPDAPGHSSQSRRSRRRTPPS